MVHCILSFPYTILRASIWPVVLARRNLKTENKKRTMFRVPYWVRSCSELWCKGNSDMMVVPNLIDLQETCISSSTVQWSFPWDFHGLLGKRHNYSSYPLGSSVCLHCIWFSMLTWRKLIFLPVQSRLLLSIKWILVAAVSGGGRHPLWFSFLSVFTFWNLSLFLFRSWVLPLPLMIDSLYLEYLELCSLSVSLNLENPSHYLAKVLAAAAAAAAGVAVVPCCSGDWL